MVCFFFPDLFRDFRLLWLYISSCDKSSDSKLLMELREWAIFYPRVSWLLGFLLNLPSYLPSLWSCCLVFLLIRSLRTCNIASIFMFTFISCFSFSFLDIVYFSLIFIKFVAWMIFFLSSSVALIRISLFSSKNFFTASNSFLVSLDLIFKALFYSRSLAIRRFFYPEFAAFSFSLYFLPIFYFPSSFWISF